MKKILFILSIVFTLSSCNVKKKLLNYTGLSDSDRLGVPEQVEQVEQVELISDTSDAKTHVDIPIVTEHDNKQVEIAQSSDVSDGVLQTDPVVNVPEIKSDENYIFLVYLIGGLLIVWVIVRILIKHKK